MARRAREIEAVMRRVLEERGTSTACPSDVARAVDADDWRPLMAEVRAVAARLQAKGVVQAYQHGRPVDPLAAKGPIRLRSVAAAAVDHRAHPERYRIGRGEEGVLTVEPYKSELLPLWRFRTEALARESAAALWKRFVAYGRAGDFVGMDMARKFIQMGWTRARRYANHRSGRKYGAGRRVLPAEPDDEKARAAAVFKATLDRALANRTYRKLRAAHER